MNTAWKNGMTRILSGTRHALMVGALAVAAVVLFDSCGFFLFPGPLLVEEAATRQAQAEELRPELLLALWFLSNQNNNGDSGCPGYDWGLPSGVPVPSVSTANCMSAEKVALGRLLFYDRRLSGDESMSCATCHRQAFAFTDRLATPRGITGETHPRNSQQLSNTAYHTKLTWANPTLASLESQAGVPIFSTSGPSTIVELGATDAAFEKIRADTLYREAFASAFGAGTERVTELNIRRALAAFQRTLLSFGSEFDKNQRGESNTMSAAAKRGRLLFNGETAECFHCHGGFNFTDTTTHSSTVESEFFFHNNGLYSAAEYAAKPPRERGLVDVTGNQSDEGKFRAPSLRNVGLTFPYMHDGSITCDGAFAGDADACATNALGKIVTHYMSGGKVHPTVDTTLIRPFSLTAAEQTDLVEFLKSLSDTSFISNTKLSNPRPADANFGP